METGIYKVRNKSDRYYAVVDESEITLHTANRIPGGWLADTTQAVIIPMNTSETANRQSITFVNRSFDLDVLSILFKYRPTSFGIPNQLNTDFNTAGYIGYRTDAYIISFDKNPLNSYQRRINHFAYSAGFFAGLGATQISPFVTKDAIQSEYDGVVLTNGLSGLIGIGDLTFGLSLGLDHLLDKNHKVWIYNSKPWLGFTVGLNIN